MYILFKQMWLAWWKVTFHKGCFETLTLPPANSGTLNPALDSVVIHDVYFRLYFYEKIFSISIFPENTQSTFLSSEYSAQCNRLKELGPSQPRVIVVLIYSEISVEAFIEFEASTKSIVSQKLCDAVRFPLRLIMKANRSFL